MAVRAQPTLDPSLKGRWWPLLDGIEKKQELFPIWSNLFFLIPVCIGIRNRHYKSAVFLFMTMAFSSIYHSCDNMIREQNNNVVTAIDFWLLGTIGNREKKVWVCWDISYNSLQFLDFFYARLCIAMICMKICVIPKEHKENIFHVYYSLIIIITVLNRHNIMYTGSIVSFDLMVPTISTIRSLYYWCFSWSASGEEDTQEFKRPYTLAINRYRFLGCCLFFVAGIVCFEESTQSNYSIMHSLWHMFMSLSCAIALSQRPAQAEGVADAPVEEATAEREGARDEGGPSRVFDGALSLWQDRPYTRQRGTFG